jgi:hypothetical protein
MQKLAILGWLLLGTILGWAMAVHFWQAGYMHAYGDSPEMLLVVAGCTVLATVYGARRHLYLLPRLIAYPLFLAGLTWMMRPQVGGIGKAFRYERDAAEITHLYPWLIVMLVIGGLLAVSFVKLRSTNNTASPLRTGESISVRRTGILACQTATDRNVCPPKNDSN